ncbi:unnamed protein product [Mytilus coruscus]|uniref:Uncharacterized protein n=1 Tax=Mytilus coruscus TaxID=42192 RepID=A0A6J8EUE7_MYTCO|nr:unnamed protein product [Mytilus coruscus]
MSIECSFFRKFASINCDLEIPLNLNSFNQQTKTQLFAELGHLQWDSNPHNKTNICQNHLNLIHQKPAHRSRKQSCDVSELINPHKKQSRSKRTAISADRKIGVDHVPIIYRNTGYVLPVGTAIFQNRSSFVICCTEPADEFDPYNERKSGGLSSKVSRKQNVHFNQDIYCSFIFQNDHHNTTSPIKSTIIMNKEDVRTIHFRDSETETETLLSDEETSEANTKQSQGSFFNPEDFSQETDSQNDNEENNSPLKSFNAFLASVNISPVQGMCFIFKCW